MWIENSEPAITVIARSILKSNTYAWRFIMWLLRRAFCLGRTEWHHLRSVPRTAPVRWAVARIIWSSSRPEPDSQFWLRVSLQQQDLAKLAPRYLLRGHNYLNTAPNLGFVPFFYFVFGNDQFHRRRDACVVKLKKAWPWCIETWPVILGNI